MMAAVPCAYCEASISIVGSMVALTGWAWKSSVPRTSHFDSGADVTTIVGNVIATHGELNMVWIAHFLASKQQ